MLNCVYAFYSAPRAPHVVAMALQRRSLLMIDAFTDPTGMHVDYRSMRASKQFTEYCQAAAELQCIDVSIVAGGGAYAKAFFLNLYNAMVCHGICAFGSVCSHFSSQCFFDKVQYRIGPWRLSLNDIEHGVLRANRGTPMSLYAPFSGTDARSCLCFKTVDPRIHFALVCGAKGCPAIRVYCQNTVDAALDGATAAFCADSNNLSISAATGTVKLSKLLSWYRKDFPGTTIEHLLSWLLPYMPPPVRKAACILLGRSADSGDSKLCQTGGAHSTAAVAEAGATMGQRGRAGRTRLSPASSDSLSSGCGSDGGDSDAEDGTTTATHSVSSGTEAAASQYPTDTGSTRSVSAPQSVSGDGGASKSAATRVALRCDRGVCHVVRGGDCVPVSTAGIRFGDTLVHDAASLEAAAAVQARAQAPRVADHTSMADGHGSSAAASTSHTSHRHTARRHSLGGSGSDTAVSGSDEEALPARVGPSPQSTACSGSSWLSSVLSGVHSFARGSSPCHGDGKDAAITSPPKIKAQFVSYDWSLNGVT